MEIILLEKIRNLGTLGDTVKVKPGFARNYLIPQGKAVYATKENMVKFEQRRGELEGRAAERHQKALERQQAIQTLASVTMIAKASEEGKLFGSVSARDMAEVISKAGVSVERREISLPEGALRLIGEYDIAIELESGITATIKVKIVSEG